MLFRKHIVSTRTLFQLTAALVILLAGVGAAVAATPTVNSGNPPLLVPYTLQLAAGTVQFPTTTSTAPASGYGGDNGPAVPLLNSAGVPVTGQAATMSSPFEVAVDSVGNLYITDDGNNVIREVNVTTGNMYTIAGVDPIGCGTGVTCSQRASGCADGVQAFGSKIGGKIEGIAVDAYGNVYFMDQATATVSVIYRGGTQVANFITLVNPGGVKAAGGVLPGYLYHVAGAINLTTCTASKGPPAIDNGLAFTNTAVNSTVTANIASVLNIASVGLDSAGNIYVTDSGNATVRVINTQATPQTFFQYTVQPGYMRSITNCNAALTTTCPTIVTVTVNTGIDGPVNAIQYNSQYKNSSVDAYGNVYQLNGTGSGTGVPGIYAAAAYAGGAPLTNLLIAEAPFMATLYGPTGVANNGSPAPLIGGSPVYGSSYDIINNMTLNNTLPTDYASILADNSLNMDVRPSSLLPDVFGTFWFDDNHYPEIERIDQFTSNATNIIGSTSQRATASVAGVRTSPASNANPWYCVYGNTNYPYTQGPVTYDPAGDGCPVTIGYISNGDYMTTNDGLGNIYVVDSGWQVVHTLSLGNTFPQTEIANSTSVVPPSGVMVGPVTQPIQIHFDASNPPVIGSIIPDASSTGYTTTSISIAPGIPDFTINTTTPEFPMGSILRGAMGQTTQTTNFALYPSPPTTPVGGPTCTQLGLSSPDNSYDCLVYVNFSPTAAGMRQAQLKAVTANGSTYTFQLTGIGTGGQLAIDGGQQASFATAAATGLGTSPAGSQGIAVTQSGIVYIADPGNNRVVSCPAGTFPCATPTPVTFTGVTPATLSGPMGVAVDAANNIYISDTGNNRILKVNPITATAVTLGNYLWISGAACTTSTSAPCPKAGLANETGASVTATTPPPQYAFKAPQGLAVDQQGNVYVADTGNKVVVEIPSNTALGGATPMLQYPGAPTFTTPVAVAVGPQWNTGSGPTAGQSVPTGQYIYVADQGAPSQQVVQIPPGGGDMSSNSGMLLTSASTLKTFGGNGITEPNGVAVDAAGNVYVSDGASGAVWEAPGVATSAPFQLNLQGLGTPGGLALDANGNLYIVDSTNKQVLFDNRQNPIVPFGTVPQDLGTGAQPLCANTTIQNATNVGTTGSGCPLTVTNIGNQPAVLTSPFLGAIGTSSFTATTTCTSPLPVGATCTILPLFTPTSDGLNNALVTVDGAQTLALTANGENPLAKVVLASSAGLTPAQNTATTVTATVTSFTAGITPSGTVTFTATIDQAPNVNAGLCGAPITQTVTLGSNGVATFTQFPATVAQGLDYTIAATFIPGSTDTSDSPSNATPITIAVPGITEAVTAASVTYTYGSQVPAITGTLNPPLPTGGPVTVSFTSGAGQFTNVNSYPIQTVFRGGNFCAYGFPPAFTSTGAPAVVKETPTPLNVVVPAYTTVYGAAQYNFFPGLTITGAIGTDAKAIGATFTPANTPPLDVIPSLPEVNPYPVIPTLSGKPIAAGDYTVNVQESPGTITITSAPTGLSVTPTGNAYELPSKVTSTTYSISVGSLVPAGYGIPTGTVTVMDAFVPTSATVFSLGPQFFFGNTTSGSSTVTGVTNTTVLGQGESISGPGIPTGATIASVTPGTITLSSNATATATAVQLFASAAIPPCTNLFTAATTSGSTTVTVSGTTGTGLVVGEPIAGAGIPSGATITAVSIGTSTSGTITISSAATATSAAVILTATTPTGLACNTPTVVTLSSLGIAAFNLPATATQLGTHNFSYYYSGDAPGVTGGDGKNDFLPSTLAAAASNVSGTTACTNLGAIAPNLLVDNADFCVTSTSGVIPIYPGAYPSGNGLPVAPNQNSAYPETATLQIVSENTLAVTVQVGCTVVGQAASYTTCFMTPTAATLTSAGTNTVVLGAYTPINLPLGFNFAGNTTPQSRTSTTKTVLAFLPFGVLAFCVRRRRSLSKALWMLIAIVGVGAVMTGCGSNSVDFYTPIPTGPQQVIVTVSYTPSAAILAFTGTTVSGSPTITAPSAVAGLDVGYTVTGAGIPANTTITGITLGSTPATSTITLSNNATASASAVALSEGGTTSRSYPVSLNID